MFCYKETAYKSHYKELLHCWNQETISYTNVRRILFQQFDVIIPFSYFVHKMLEFEDIYKQNYKVSIGFLAIQAQNLNFIHYIAI